MKTNIIRGLVMGMAINGLAVAADDVSESQRSDPGTAPNTMGGTNSPNSAPGMTASSSQITGTVESIDRSGNRVRVRDSQGNVNEYKVNDSTRYSNGNQTTRFSELRPGDTVTLIYNQDALSIDRMDIAPRNSDVR